MKTMQKVGQALGRLLLCLGVPQELYYINGPDTLPAPLDAQEEKESLLIWQRAIRGPGIP